MVLNIPCGNNKKLRKIVNKIKKDREINSYWETANIVAVNRLQINDHGGVHAAIVANVSLRLLRILMSSGTEPNMVKDHKLKKQDAEIVVVIAGLLHDIGHAVHRKDHTVFSIMLAPPIIDRLLKNHYNEKESVVMKSEILHAIICHHIEFKAMTLEAGCVRLADGLDAKGGRARIPFKLGKIGIHSVSALAIKDIKINKGENVPVSVEVVMQNSAGIFQVDELIKAKLRDSGLEKHVELKATIEGDEEKIVREFKL